MLFSPFCKKDVEMQKFRFWKITVSAVVVCMHSREYKRQLGKRRIRMFQLVMLAGDMCNKSKIFLSWTLLDLFHKYVLQLFFFNVHLFVFFRKV